MGMLLAGLLVGCASTATSAPASSPSVSNSRQAGVFTKSTNVRVVNSTGESINVVSTRSDTSEGFGDLAPGGTASAEGSSLLDYDVKLTVTYPDGHLLKFGVSNSAVGNAYVHDDSDTSYLCLNQGYGEGGIANWSTGKHGVTIERLPNDSWIQFRITFTRTIAGDAKYFCNRD